MGRAAGAGQLTHWMAILWLDMKGHASAGRVDRFREDSRCLKRRTFHKDLEAEWQIAQLLLLICFLYIFVLI